METQERSGTGGAGDRSLEPGHQVGEYVIDAPIGQGGFGTVYRARHPLIGKLVAVKVLARQYSSDPEILSRFVDEARAVNQIRHRNIIDIFSFGRLDDDRSYYVMELLDGQPLDQLIDDRGPCSLADAIPILRGVARALDAAHAQGIAHRDLKPENVFLTRDSEGAVFPKLLDFGIAKLLGDRAAEQVHKTRTGAPIGTPYYMSPEQARGRDVDHRTDIYAFGCMAYKLVTGVVPFDGDGHMDVLMKQIGEEPVPPSQRVAELPAAVDDVIAWMMRKDPAERPADLITGVRALEDAAAAAGISFDRGAARTPSSFTPVPSRPSAPRMPGVLGIAETVVAAPRRRRTWVAVAGAAVVLGAAAVALVVASSGERKTATAAPIAPVGEAVVRAPAAAVPPEAPLPGFVTIEIAGPPAGTEVYGPAGPLGAAPGRIQLVRNPDEVQLVLKADGYETAVTRVVPDGNKAIDVALTKKPAAPAVADARATKPPVRRPAKPRKSAAGSGAAASATDVKVELKKPPPTDPFGRK